MKAMLDGLRPEGAVFSGLRTRRSGPNRFGYVELRVPGDWSVERADGIARAAEKAASAQRILLMVRVMSEEIR